jgi:hypothetical protein
MNTAILVLNPVIFKISGYLYGFVFYMRNGKQCVRDYVIPNNPDTDAQRKVRHTFTDAVKSWQLLSLDEKHRHNRKARNLQMSGYNMYISIYMKKRILQAGNPAVAGSSGNLLRFQSVSASGMNRFDVPFPANPQGCLTLDYLLLFRSISP